MANSSVKRCLSLCSQAFSLGGEALQHTLNQLQENLASLEAEHEHLLKTSTNAIDTNSAWLYEPVISMDIGGYITGWNNGAQILFGYNAAEIIGQHILFLYADELNDASSDKNCAVNELFLEHGSTLIEVRRRKKSGEIFRANLALSHILNDKNEAIGMMAKLSKIVDRLSTEDRQRLHARIIEDSEQGILITDTDEHIVSVNAAFTSITGYTAAEAIGSTPDILRSGKHSADFRAQVRSALHGGGAWQGEIIGRRKNGELFPQSVSIGVVRDADGQVTQAFSIFSDVSVIRAAEERMKQIVNYDSLTGLPNRSLFHQLVEQALVSARRNNGYGAIMVIDLNRFTVVNDTLGHDVGDELLRQVGQRFREILRDEDILARVGGDEFVVALIDIQKREHSGLVAKKLLASLEMPFVIESHALHITASIGIAVYPEDALSTAALLRFSDVAMKRVQQSNNGSYLFYSPEMNVRAKEQWQLEGELRHALTSNELLLHYQPKVSLRSGRIVGSEALIRWKHPIHGMIPPGKFIPVAEETGLIFEVGNWVLDAACQQIRQWMDAGLEIVPVAINLSARQFDGQLTERLRTAIDRYQVPCEFLKLEMTESLLMQGQDDVIPIMNALAAMGFQLALDDFGTGYSSLAYLKKFPITTLKIDRSFVIGVPNDPNDCAIAQAIVTMGKQLRQEIVAEGVETVEQMAFLRDLGCDQLQGYLFSPAIAAEDFALMLQEKRCLDLR